MSISSHKIGGPQGVGALIRRAELDLVPVSPGGGQESGARPGTENVAGIAGFGAAAEAVLAEGLAEVERMLPLRDRLESGIRHLSPHAVIFSAGVDRLPNTTLVGLPHTKAETTVIALDLAGVAVSSGAACSSGRVAPSHVLAAMGVDVDLARGAIRLSLGRDTTEGDVTAFLNCWARVTDNLYKERPNARVIAA